MRSARSCSRRSSSSQALSPILGEHRFNRFQERARGGAAGHTRALRGRPLPPRLGGGGARPHGSPTPKGARHRVFTAVEHPINFAIYGIEPENFDGRYEGGSQWVHPEDRALVERVMREAVELGAPVDFEYRIIRPDGRVRRVRSRAELTADGDGRPLRLTGTVQDVTEVRAAAEALHETATDLGRRAAELLSDRSRHGDGDLTKHLTSRQLEILALVAEGLSNLDIASRLYLTESTVKWHVRKILRALGVANRAQAVARYLSVQHR